MKLVKNLYKLFRPSDASYHLVFPFIPFIFSDTLSFSMLAIVIILFSVSMCGFGLNNMFDVDTDSKNYKMRNKNPFVSKEIKRNQSFVIFSFFLFVSIIVSFFLFGEITFYLILAISFGALYSVPPFRFKRRFIFDMIFHGLGTVFFMLYSFFIISLNSNYLLPATIACFLISTLFNLGNEIDDYESDKKANLKTTVVTLGKRTSFLVYFVLFVILYLLSIVVLIEKLYIFILLLGFTSFLIQLIITVGKFLKVDDISISQTRHLYYPLLIFSSIILVQNLIRTIV